ncbi:MAG: twin-arginine translocase subunit TatB [Oleiphilaceae bacterium]|nr:twin-arginine translocase subunit TatB [Oleiphilaceae bacterium]
MFDIGFLELVICGVIALLILGPERLPGAARTAGRWLGRGRRMVTQFSSELDRQLKAEELREELRKAGDVGLEDVEKNVRSALDEAKKYQDMVVPNDQVKANKSPKSGPQVPPSGRKNTEEAVSGAHPPSERVNESAPDRKAGPEDRS